MAQQFPAKDGLVPGPEPGCEFMHQLIRPLPRRVVIVLNLAVFEPDDHERAGNRAAGLAQTPHSAAEGPGDF